MNLIRVFFVVILTLSTSLAGAVDMNQMSPMKTIDAPIEHQADDHTPCCSNSSEQLQTCHIMPALVPSTDFGELAPTTNMRVSIEVMLLLEGIEPAGLLDPPRAV